jgi:WhiB family redox-sensing transcriptional regulator
MDQHVDVRSRDTLDAQPSEPRWPVTETWAWQMRANCRDMPSSVFYPPEGERGGCRRRREQRAKRICRDCAVVRECLAHALQWPEDHGIWAATTPAERRLWLRQSSSP